MSKIPLMTAQTFNPERKANKWPMWAEPKLDGFRFHIVFDDAADYQVLQRSGKNYTDRLGWIAEQMVAAVEALYPEGVTLDGEAYGGSWGNTTTLVTTQDDIDRSDLMFYCFDIVADDTKGLPLRERKPLLEELILVADAPNVSTVLHVEVEGPDSMDGVYEKFLEHGFEGAMMKEPDALYEIKRSWGWQKAKPWETTEGQIIGYEEGKKRLVGTLGALIVRTLDGVDVEVGGGFTDALRGGIWSHRAEHLGRWIEFKYQDDRKLVAKYRFPIYLRHRVDLEYGMDIPCSNCARTFVHSLVSFGDDRRAKCSGCGHHIKGKELK